MYCMECGRIMYQFLIDTGDIIREGYICPNCGNWQYQVSFPTVQDRDNDNQRVLHPWKSN